VMVMLYYRNLLIIVSLFFSTDPSVSESHEIIKVSIVDYTSQHEQCTVLHYSLL